MNGDVVEHIEIRSVLDAAGGVPVDSAGKQWPEDAFFDQPATAVERWAITRVLIDREGDARCARVSDDFFALLIVLSEWLRDQDVDAALGGGLYRLDPRW